MAYITTEQVKEFRDNIKKEFPTKKGWKFSIRRENYTSIDVTILEAPLDFPRIFNRECKGFTANFSVPELQMINEIINVGNHDNSDPMTDYFDVGWYSFIYIGHWKKGFKFNKQ